MKRRYLAMLMAMTMLASSAVPVSATEVSDMGEVDEYSVNVDSSFEVPISDLSEIVVTIPADLDLTYSYSSGDYEVESLVNARGTIADNCIVSVSIAPYLEYTNQDNTAYKVIARNTYSQVADGFGWWTAAELARDGGVSKDFRIYKAANEVLETGTYDTLVEFDIKCHKTEAKEIVGTNTVLTFGTISSTGSSANGNTCSVTISPALIGTLAASNGGTYEFPVFAYDSTNSSYYLITGLTKSGNGSIDANFSGLTSAIVPEGVKVLDHTFKGAQNLTSVTLPKSLTTLSGTFNYCSSLRGIELPLGLTEIGASTFANSGITSLDIPETVTSIGSYAFSYCTSLRTIEIPSKVTSLEAHLFTGCTALEEITIHSTLNSFRSAQVFDSCTSLSTVNYDGTIAQFNTITGIQYLAEANCNSGNLTVHCTDGDLVYIDGVLQ